MIALKYISTNSTILYPNDNFKNINYLNSDATNTEILTTINTILENIMSNSTSNTQPNIPTITYIMDTSTGNTEGLSPDCIFGVSGMNLFLDQTDSESGFYINTSGGQSLKCEIVNQNIDETGISEYVLINPVSFTDSASYLTYKQLESNGSYYIVRYPTNGTFSIE